MDTKDKLRDYGVFWVAVAVLLFGLIFFVSTKGFSNQGKYVEVKGLSERIVKADRAIWSIGFEVKSNSIDEASAGLEKNITAIKSFLTEKGFEASEINMAPVNVYQDTYSGALFRYNANAYMSVYTTKVDLVKSASSDTLALVKKGIPISQNSVNFEFSDLNSIKPEMLAEAIKNARVSAEQFAKDARSSLGDISRANQGVFDITEKDPGSPEYKKIRVVSSFRFLLD